MYMSARSRWVIVSQLVLFTALVTSIVHSGVGRLTYAVFALFTLATVAASVSILCSDSVGSERKQAFPKAIIGASLGITLLACARTMYHVNAGRPAEPLLFLPGVSGLLLGSLVFWLVARSTEP